MRGPVLIRYGIRGGLTGGFATVPQVPGREDERTAAGDGGEGGNRGEQRGGHGGQADEEDRYRDAEVDAHEEGRADLGTLLVRRDAGHAVLRGEEGHAMTGSGQVPRVQH